MNRLAKLLHGVRASALGTDPLLRVRDHQAIRAHNNTHSGCTITSLFVAERDLHAATQKSRTEGRL